MKVSVIIPTYNRFKCLLRAIESVKNQNYPDIEIIVVNDRSTHTNQGIGNRAHPNNIYIYRERERLYLIIYIYIYGPWSIVPPMLPYNTLYNDTL